jgi:hypothetical protein
MKIFVFKVSTPHFNLKFGKLKFKKVNMCVGDVSIE